MCAQAIPGESEHYATPQIMHLGKGSARGRPHSSPQKYTWSIPRMRFYLIEFQTKQCPYLDHLLNFLQRLS